MASSSDYAYRVEWSPEDNEFVGLVTEFPSLSWLAPTEDEALRGIIDLEARGIPVYVVPIDSGDSASTRLEQLWGANGRLARIIA